jgi:hypothetical protein
MRSRESRFEEAGNHEAGTDPRQTDTVLLSPAPASLSSWQDHCSRQSAVSRQFTRQIQPVVSSAAQDEPEGQLLEPPQDRVQTLPGNGAPDWQSPLSHSLLSIQGAPTRVLSLPAVPDGRPSSPHPNAKSKPSKVARRMNEELMAG